MNLINRYIASTTIAQFVRFSCSCALALGTKLGTMWLCLKFAPPLVSYLIVQFVVFFISYILHATVSFRSHDFSIGTIWRYFTTVISFKVIDYLVFSVIFAYFHINAMAAVLIASLLIMLVRFTAVRRALVRGEHASAGYAGEVV
ncbi:MAG: hypothetical protein RL518_2739 [Pseudomonadota bacterium]|jgi:hypothetical protein